MYSIVLFLNTCPAGGGTRFYKDSQKEDLELDPLGRFIGKPEHVEFTVESKAGRIILFYHNIMHEGVPIRKGTKYIIRSDVMYKRVPPLLINNVDKYAYKLYSDALLKSESSNDEESLKVAAAMFRRAFKMSPLLADIYGM